MLSMSYRKSNLSERDQKLAAKMSRRDIADAVGMPDDIDKRNIETIIRNFNRLYPGQVAAVINDAKKDVVVRKVKVNPEVGTKRMSLPIPLMRMIEESYPAMFTSKKHFDWFMKNFKGLDLERQ